MAQLSLKSIAGRTLAVTSEVLRRLIFMQIKGAELLYEQSLRLNFAPRADDIFIVSYPKSVNTWVQMILYQLTTDGDMENLRHMAEYIPWFENPRYARIDFETLPSPRVFKSHLRYKEVPKQVKRYIHVARDCKDVIVSYYYHQQKYGRLEDSFDTFFNDFLRGRYSSWFDYVAGWYARKHDPHVLLITFEELIADIEQSIRKIADFCGIPIDPNDLPRIVERCGFAYMKRYEERIAPPGGGMNRTIKRKGSPAQAAPPPPDFLRGGRVGDGSAHLSDRQLRLLEQKLSQYAELRALYRPVSADLGHSERRHA